MTRPALQTIMGLIALVFNLIRAIVGIVEYAVLSIAKFTRWLWDKIRFQS